MRDDDIVEHYNPKEELLREIRFFQEQKKRLEEWIESAYTDDAKEFGAAIRTCIHAIDQHLPLLHQRLGELIAGYDPIQHTEEVL